MQCHNPFLALCNLIVIVNMDQFVGGVCQVQKEFLESMLGWSNNLQVFDILSHHMPMHKYEAFKSLFKD